MLFFLLIFLMEIYFSLVKISSATEIAIFAKVNTEWMLKLAEAAET